MNVPVSQPRPRDVVVIHETDGKKYLEALTVLAGEGQINSISFHSASVLWRLAHAILRERRTLSDAMAMAADNLAFRCRLPFLKNKIVVLAIAPWDWRMVFYAMLPWRNVLIYNTSWPWWGEDEKVPRRYGPLSPLLRRLWRKALSQPNVAVTAVTKTAAAALENFLPDQQATVISHVVSETFFAAPRSASTARDGKLRLLYVGELSAKKGFPEFQRIVARLGDAVEAEVIGDGPLRTQAEAFSRQPARRWHGRITDRKRHAAIAASCHILLSPAHKTESWEELFGMAIVEAMATGVVCIVTNQVGPRSFIRHGINGVLAEEGNETQIEDWVRRLGSDRETLRTMSEAAADTAVSFRMDHVVRMWRAMVAEAEARSSAVRHAASRPDEAEPAGSRVSGD